MDARRWLCGASVPAVLLALATASHAADAFLPPPQGVPTPVYNWSGFYLGGNAGYLGIDSDGFFATSVDLALCGATVLGGAQVGWNIQRGNWVFGVEPDFSFFDCDDTNLREEHYLAEADFLGTVRGRVGWADDNVLFYATAGLAYLSARVETSLGGLDADQQGNEDSKDFSTWGGVAGAGIEWGLARHFSIKAEALYFSLNEDDTLADLIEGCAPGIEGCLPVGTNFFSIDDGFLFRLGANLRLGGTGLQEPGVVSRHAGASTAYDWSGFYVGAHVGAGGVDNEGVYFEDRISPVPNPAPIDLSEFENEGLLGGAQIGFNWQVSSFVFGVEADAAGVDWDDLIVDLQIPVEPQTLAFDLDVLATARARFGWAADNLLFYLTGGVAYVGGEFEGLTIPGSEDVSAVGGAFGGGVEWGLRRNLSLRAEALYLAFDDETSLADVTEEASSEDHVEIGDGYALRVGANWRLGRDAVHKGHYRAGHPRVGTATGYNWTGVYVGSHAGVGGLVTDGLYNPETIIPDEEDPAANQAIDLTGVDNLGAVGGGQIGWNWQVRSLVFGFEGDLSAVDWDGEEAEFANPEDIMEFESEVLATARARLGWAEDDLLMYLTSGLAFVGAELDNTQNDGGRTKDVDALGGVAGLGLEWGATRNLSVKLEGLFLFFDEDTNIEDIGSEGDPGDFFRIDDGFVARLGANWRFNPFH